MAFLKKLRFPKFSRNKKETAETKVTDEKFPSDVVDAEKKAAEQPQLSPVTEDRDGDDAESNMDGSTNADKKGSVAGSEASVGDATDETREVPESSKTTKSDWDCCGVTFTMP